MASKLHSAKDKETWNQILSGQMAVLLNVGRDLVTIFGRHFFSTFPLSAPCIILQQGFHAKIVWKDACSCNIIICSRAVAAQKKGVWCQSLSLQWFLWQYSIDFAGCELVLLATGSRTVHFVTERMEELECRGSGFSSHHLMSTDQLLSHKETVATAGRWPITILIGLFPC